MTTDRTRTSSAFSNVAAEQKKIHDFLDRRDRVLMLRQPHRPATNDPLATHRNFSGFTDLFATQSTRFDDLFPRRRPNVCGEFVEVGRELLDELSI